MTGSKVAVLFVTMVVVSVALGALLAYPAMLLWNGCLVPAVPGVTEVTWLQMWGLTILCSILFKNMSVSSKSD